VLLFEPERSPYDLNWRMFGTDVRVHPMFWLVSLIMGGSLLNDANAIQMLLLWIGCVFVSILIHEFGHVLMGRFFGYHGHIVLYGFGGLAIGSSGMSNRGQRIAVSFAGPFAGFLFLGVLAVVLWWLQPALVTLHFGALLRMFGLPVPEAWARLMGEAAAVPPLVHAALRFLIFINLFWGLINLLPIWPLDGGHISRDFLSMLNSEKGATIATGISFVVAGVLAIHCLLAMNDRPLIPFLPIGSLFSAILFALLAVQSFQLLQQSQFDRPPWRRYDP
jgi:stage IV sporulation protein FB